MVCGSGLWPLEAGCRRTSRKRAETGKKSAGKKALEIRSREKNAGKKAPEVRVRKRKSTKRVKSKDRKEKKQ